MYHYLLADLPGTWERCVIRGYMGEYWGFKAFQYDEKRTGDKAWLLTSPSPAGEIPGIGRLRRRAYRRTIIPARMGIRRVWAQIYEARDFT